MRGGNRLYSKAVTAEGAGGGSVGESRRVNGCFKQYSVQEHAGDRCKF